jgi:hypothetical protein
MLKKAQQLCSPLSSLFFVLRIGAKEGTDRGREALALLPRPQPVFL